MQDPFTVELAFYGPVTWDTGFPFLVEYSTDNGANWTADPYWDVFSGQGTRFITLIYNDDPSAIPPGRLYRVRPDLNGSDALLCDDLFTTEDVPVADFTYTFETP